MFLSYFFFISYNQCTRSKFVRSLTKRAEAERSFEERFLETVRQFPVIYDNTEFVFIQHKELALGLASFLHLFSCC